MKIIKLIPPNKKKPLLRPFYFTIGLSCALLGSSFSATAHTNFTSFKIGGGNTFASQNGNKLQTWHNHGMIRLAFALSPRPFFWSIDLETFRIQKSGDQLQAHHHGEGGGFSVGVFARPFSLWLQGTKGRMRVLANDNEELIDLAERQPYHSFSIGMSYSIMKRDFANIDLELTSKHLSVTKRWKQLHGFGDLQMVSMMVVFTLIDL